MPRNSTDGGEDVDKFIDNTLNAILSSADCNEQADEDMAEADESIAGATAYTLSFGRVVFLSPAESYNNQGDEFAMYSPVEYESVVQLERKKDEKKPSRNGAGRPCRKRFALGKNHPLFDYDAAIRLKFMVPIPGGRRYPAFPDQPLPQPHTTFAPLQTSRRRTSKRCSRQRLIRKN